MPISNTTNSLFIIRDPNQSVAFSPLRVGPPADWLVGLARGLEFPGTGDVA